MGERGRGGGEGSGGEGEGGVLEEEPCRNGERPPLPPPPPPGANNRQIGQWVKLLNEQLKRTCKWCEWSINPEMMEYRAERVKADMLELERALAWPNYTPVPRSRREYKSTLEEAKTVLVEAGMMKAIDEEEDRTPPPAADRAERLGWQEALRATLEQMREVHQQQIQEMHQQMQQQVQQQLQQMQQQLRQPVFEGEVRQQAHVLPQPNPLHIVPPSPAPSCLDTQSIQSMGSSSASTSSQLQRQNLERQLLELQGQQAYEQEQIRQSQAARAAEIARLNYMMRNS